MKIHIGADHRGWELKKDLVEWLQKEGHDVIDVGPTAFDQQDDYPDYGIKVAEGVAQNPEEHFGIAICGSGAGMAVVANKVPGIRAALIHDPEVAAAARRDDAINVLALGALYIDGARAKEVIRAWLETPFSQAERHQRRIGKIAQYEQQRLQPPAAHS